MPMQAVQYKVSHNLQLDDVLLGIVRTDSRPPRPNSIERRRSYLLEEQHLYCSPSFNFYRETNYYMTQGYDDNLYGSHYVSGQKPLGDQCTSSRGGRLRSSQSSPAPSSNAFNNFMPTMAFVNNTPIRGRFMSIGRDILPPPPLPRETMSPPSMNDFIPPHLLNRSGSRSDSPLLSQRQLGADETDLALQDLPLFPFISGLTLSRLISSPCNIPPPLPSLSLPPVANGSTAPLLLTNGDIAKMIATNLPKFRPLKSIVNDQLKKPVNPNIPLIKKIEQKEVERVNAFNDIASILARVALPSSSATDVLVDSLIAANLIANVV
ncbi:Wiskott-Aldrich syndrome protein family member 3 [Temnothorax longispinosus]|uniref:Wiskott-Aldrich syndrome protein family member 3 n=1 Tax=Temnothorax longispinosus TaxID=300112 RepID=A0A4V3SB80_9HYME|nr:Wiskott-Aldrich syndrome protein family member 3 [Temnothorax longispinosus]